MAFQHSVIVPPHFSHRFHEYSIPVFTSAVHMRARHRCHAGVGYLSGLAAAYTVLVFFAAGLLVLAAARVLLAATFLLAAADARDLGERGSWSIGACVWVD